MSRELAEKLREEWVTGHPKYIEAEKLVNDLKDNRPAWTEDAQQFVREREDHIAKLRQASNSLTELTRALKSDYNASVGLQNERDDDD